MKLLALISGFVALLTAPVHGQEPVRFALGDAFPPQVSSKLPYGGMTTRIVSRAFEKAGYQIAGISWQPWARTLVSVKTGEADITFPWSQTSDREADYLFSAPIVTVTNYLWVHASHPETPLSGSDFRNKTYCQPIGYAEFGTITRLQEDHGLQLVTVADVETCFRMLNAGRVNFVSANPYVGRAILLAENIKTGSVRRTNFVVTSTEHRMMIGKAKPAWRTASGGFPVRPSTT